MNINFLTRRPIEGDPAICNRYLVAFVLVCAVWVANYFVGPKWPWQSELSEETAFITSVDLSRIFTEQLSADGEQNVAVQLVNTSKSTAQSVSLTWDDGGAGTDSTFSKISVSSENSVFSLEPGQEKKIVVVPLIRFLSVFQSRCPGCFFLGVSKDQRMPVDIIAKLCKGLLEKGRPCHMEYDLFPIVFSRKFKTVSGDEFSGKNTAFVYLSRTFNTEYSVPKN